MTVEALAEILVDFHHAEPASTFLRGAMAVEQPGLYTWWADDEGLRSLSEPFDVQLPPLIYGGQAGATSSRSRTERVATLRSRIGGNHLSGNVSSSTFRKTLTAVLVEPLDLRLVRPGRLDAESNNRLSDWMRNHLRIAVAPVEDRHALAALEHAVLQRLDPPLNLMGMAPTPVRIRLRQLRRELKDGPATPPSAVR